MTVDLKNSNLTLIQVLAALLVVYFHSFPLGDGTCEWVIRFFRGHMMVMGGIAVGVFLFFSGFLVSRSLPPPSSTFAERLHWVGDYAIKRFLRIFPPVAFAVLLAIFVIGPLFTTLPLDRYFSDRLLLKYAGNLSLLHVSYRLPGLFCDNIFKGAVNGSLWVIPWQVLCYAFLALVGLMGAGRNRKLVTFVLVGAWMFYFLRGVLFPKPSYLDLDFKAGMRLTALFATGWWANVWAERIWLDGRIALLCAVVLFFFLGNPLFEDLAFAFLGGYCLLYLAFSHSLKWVGRLPQLSLAIFVLAFPIQQALTALWGGKMPAVLNFVLSTAVLVPLAWIELVTIEKIAGRLRNAILSRRSER